MPGAVAPHSHLCPGPAGAGTNRPGAPAAPWPTAAQGSLRSMQGALEREAGGAALPQTEPLVPSRRAPFPECFSQPLHQHVLEVCGAKPLLGLGSGEPPRAASALCRPSRKHRFRVKRVRAPAPVSHQLRGCPCPPHCGVTPCPPRSQPAREDPLSLLQLSPGTFPMAPVPPEDESERGWPGNHPSVPSSALAVGGGGLGRGFCPHPAVPWAVLPRSTWGSNSRQCPEHRPRSRTHAVLANMVGASQPARLLLGFSLHRREPGCRMARRPVCAGTGERLKAWAGI